MNRFLAFAAAGAVAVLLAAPANAASVRVSAVGKSPEQLHADILKAARYVCAASSGSTGIYEPMRTCVKATVAHAVANSGIPALVALAPPTQLAQR